MTQTVPFGVFSSKRTLRFAHRRSAARAPWGPRTQGTPATAAFRAQGPGPWILTGFGPFLGLGPFQMCQERPPSLDGFVIISNRWLSTQIVDFWAGTMDLRRCMVLF